VRTSNGKVNWKTASGEEGAGCYAGAAVLGNLVVFASQGERVFGVDAASGHIRWNFRAKGKVESSPVIAGNTVYVGSADGNLYGLSAANGRKVWQFTAGAEIKASPAVSKGRLVIGSTDGAIYCFGQ
jgi:outer membrane protein assembly factor BamB